jgi:predicted nucleotidyltransferase
MVEELRQVLAADPRIAYALLFGSRARRTAHAGSDVDLAIGILPGTGLTALDLGQLVSKLDAVASGTHVDLVLLDEAPPALAFRIFRDGQVLFERDHARLVARKARAILEYLDWKPFEDIFTRGVLQAASRRG